MPNTCLVIPCYNESERLDISSFINCYNNNSDIFLCFVNDGSTDNTSEILNSLRKERNDRILIIDQAKNGGKAVAVRVGVENALKWHSFDYIGYFDADLSTPLAELDIFKEKISSNNDYQIVFGSRIRRLGSRIERNPFRHYLGRIFATIVSLLLGLNVYDTQCGAKLFSSEIAMIIFEKPFLSKWLFDIELIFRIIDAFGLVNAKKIIYEIPLNKWIDKGPSRIPLIYFTIAPFELLRIYLYYRKSKGKR